jgi:hypothetical protein
MNPVADYIKNLGKSVGYAAIQHINEKSPAMASFAESNQELYKEVFHSVRDYRTTIQRSKDLIQKSTVYRLGDSAFNNALEDIKSGKLYNKEREDSSFGDFGDMDMSSFDEGFDSASDIPTDITTGDQMVVKAVGSASQKNAFAVTNAVASSAQYVADTNKSIANMHYTQMTRVMSSMQSGFNGISNGIDALYNFNTQVVGAHAENSKKFFENTTGLLQEQNAILKEMLQMQREKYKVALQEDKERKANRFDDVVNVSGTPDLKAYAKAIGGNFKNAINEQSGGMLSMLSEENLKMFANNPLAAIPQMLIATAMGPKLNTALQKFDATLSGAFATMTAKFNKMASDDNANPLEQFLGKVFGLKNNVKNTIDTSKYEQGPIQFNGLAQKSIVEVMPGHLRRIEALLSGQNERFFDYKSGKWTNAKAVKDQFNSIKKNNVTSSMSDVSDEMAEMMKALSFKSRQDKESMIKDMGAMFEKIYDDYGFFDPNNKDEFSHVKYGVSSKSNMKLLQSMFKNLRRGTAMKMANQVQSQRETHNRQMENIEKEGNSLFGNLFNGYDADSHIKTTERGEIKERYGNLGDQSNLLKIQDPFKKNIFDYLRGIQQELFSIRKLGSMGPGPSRGSRGRRNSQDTTDFSQLSDEDWKKYFENRLGPREKSNKQLNRERESRADDAYRVSEDARVRRLTSQGRIIAGADKWMDDTSRATGAIYANSVNRDVQDNRRAMSDNSTWINDMMTRSAKNSKARLESTAGKENADGVSFLDQLIQAGSLGAKYDVIRSGIDKLTAKPTDILTGVLTKADENIYNFFYGQETDVKDERGNKIKGFFNRMTWEMKGTFGKVNSWIDDTLLKPFKDKFAGKSMWGASKNALKGMGIDIDGIGKGIKDYFVGDEGLLRPTIDAVKSAYNEAYEEVKRDMRKSYKDANQFYNNTVLGQQTTEQKLTSAKKITGVDAIDETIAFKNAAAANKSVQNSNAQHAKNIKERNAIIQELNKTTDPQKIAELQDKLKAIDANRAISGKRKAMYDRRVSNFEARQKEIEQTNLAIRNYNTDDSDILSQRESKLNELNKMKGTLNLPSNSVLGKIDLNSPEYAHLNDKNISKSFDKAKSLEAEIDSLKTELEKLNEKRTSLQNSQKEAWGQFGTTREKAMADPELIMAQAKANRKSFKGNDLQRKSFDDALGSLATILGLASLDPEAKVAYKKVDELEQKYLTAVKGLGSGDPIKSIRVQINQNATAGKDTSKLTKKMNDILAAKGSLFGRYADTFSNVLGKMRVPQDQISSTVDKLLNSNSMEELAQINKSINKFIAAVKQVNPIIAPFLQSYEKDSVLENYAEQGKFESFSSDIASADHFGLEDLWRDQTQFKNPEKRSNYAMPEHGDIHHYANGARNITKSGLSIVSEGEAIIPSDMNPFNPNIDKADRRKDEKNEKSIKQRIGKIFNANDIAENANGTPSFGNDGAITKGFNNFKSGVGEFTNQLFNTKEASAKIGKVNDEVRKHLPKGIAGGLLGGTVGLLTGIGGPLLGAIAGSALSVVTNSEILQKSLFGEKVYDSNGDDTGKRNGGLFSSELQESMKKYLPDAKTYGITGTVLGMLTPLGPIGGLMMGSAISFAKNNESVKSALFGEKDGLFNGDTQKAVQKAFPNVAAAVVGSMFLGPFGLLGNAAIGTGLGLVSTTDEFKDFMLGKADSKGQRKGGLSGAIKEVMIDPLASFSSTVKNKFFDFMKKDMIDPIKRSIAPIGKQISLAIKDTFGLIGKTFTSIVKSSLGIPFINQVKESLKYWMDPLGINKFVFKSGAKLAGKVISAPSKAIGWVGDKLRQHQIEKSNADYMTANERLEFMASKGKDYKLKEYDSMLSNTKKEELEKAHDLMGELKKGKGFLDERHDEYVKDLGSTVSNKFDVATSKAILKAAHSGDMEKAHQLIQDSDLSTAEKEKLFKQVNVKANKVREIKYRKDNYTGNENEVYEKLQKEYGIKGINSKNLDKYRSVLQTEIQSRSTKDEEKDSDQFSSINSSLDANTDKLVGFMKAQVEILAQIRDNAMGVSPEQNRDLKRTNKLGENVAGKYIKSNNRNADKLNRKVSKLYGGQEISNRYNLADNQYKFEAIDKLAKNKYKFSDLDKVLEYDGDTFSRFIALGQTGYNVKDYDKIAKMSDEAFGNVLTFAQTGMKITDIDKVMNANPEVIKGMVELHEGGFKNVSQETLSKMVSRKSQYLGHGKKAALKAMKSSSNEDDSKNADTVEKINKNVYEPPDNSAFAQFKDGVRDRVSSVAQQAREYANDAKIGAMIAGAYNQIKKEFEPENEFKNLVQVETDYGVASYTRSTDGSMDMANTKNNKSISDKISQRDETQKGILENLKSMAGNAKGKVKEKAGAVKDSAKGGLLGALGGLLDLAKLPLNLFKGLGSMLGLPLQLLGLGGVAGKAAGWAGGKLSNVGKTALDFAGGKLGGMASNIKDKLLGTKIGQKVTGKLDALNTKFGASKIGKMFSKGKSLLGGAGLSTGTAGASAVDEEGNAIEEPSDVLGAINVHRTTMVDYLKQIVELLQNGGSGESSGNPIQDIAQDINESRSDKPAGSSKVKGSKNRWLSKIGNGIKKYGGKAALLTGAVYGLSQLMPSGAEASPSNGFSSDDYDGQNTPTTGRESGSFDTAGAALSAVTLASNLDSDMVQKAQVFLAKAKDGLKGLVAKLGNWIPNKGVYAGIQEFCAKLMEKMSTPRNLTKIVEKLGAKLALGPAYAAIGAATAGAGAVVLGAVESMGWFLHGWSNAGEMLGVKSGATNGMKFVSGLVDAVVSMIPVLGIVIPSDEVLNMALDFVGPPFGFTRSDVEKLKKANDQANKQTSSAIDEAQNPTSNNSFIQNAWDATKKFGGDVWQATKNGANYAIEKASDAIDSVKEKGNSAVDWVQNNAKYVAEKAGNMWQSAKDTVSNWWNGRGKSGNKFGRGNGTLAAGFKSQLDPANAMNFNTSQDSVPQTMEDSGCGPVSAANMASAFGVNIDPKAAAKYALSKGYKEKDGGTEPGYFGDILGKYGIGTQKVQSSSDIKNNLSQGNPVLLMGKDNKGVNSNNPYGQYNHYVVGTGIDNSGNITIQDPESTTPNKIYKSSDVLNKSSMAIAASNSGFGKFGRGNKIANRISNKLGRGKWGRGGDVGQIAWDFLISKGFSNQATAGILGNLLLESGLDPTKVEGGGSAPEITVNGSTGYGIAQWTSEGRQQGLVDYARSMGTSTSDLNTQLGYMVSEMSPELIGKLNAAKSVDEAMNIFCDDFERPDARYAHKDRRLDYAQQFFQNQGKGVANAGNASGGTQSSSSKKNTGFFGKLGELSKTLGGQLQQSLGPLAGAIASQAGSFFGGDNIKAMFGDDNPFSSIFGSKDNKSSGDSSQSGGKFTSNSTNAGIKNASNWASGLAESGEPQGYGPNGCTAFTKDYLEHAGNEFAKQMSLYTPTLMQQAQSSGLWKDASQPGAEGDIALLNTDSNASDPDHVVISDGQGGYFGNSSSTLKVKYGNIGDTFGKNNLFGYVATGAGDGSVVTGDKTNDVDTAAEAGPTSAKGKSGRNKFGMGKFGLGTAIDQVRDSIKDIPTEFVQDYNQISDDDSLDVAKAKAQKIREMWVASKSNSVVTPEGIAESDLTVNTLNGKKPIGTVDPTYANSLVKEATKNTNNPLKSIPTSFTDGYNISKDILNRASKGKIKLNKRWGKGSESIVDSIEKNIIDPNSINPNRQTNQQTTAQQIAINPTSSAAPAPDYSSKFDTVIGLLSVIAEALTGQKQDAVVSTNTNSTSKSKGLNPAAILSKLSAMGNGSNNGFGDLMATRDTQSIIAAMTNIAAKPV